MLDLNKKLAELEQLADELSRQLYPDRMTAAQRADYWYRRAMTAEARAAELERALKED